MNEPEFKRDWVEFAFLILIVIAGTATAIKGVYDIFIK